MRARWSARRTQVIQIFFALSPLATMMLHACNMQFQPFFAPYTSLRALSAENVQTASPELQERLGFI